MSKRPKPLWPRILAFLDEKTGYYTVGQIAAALDETPARVWASMSSVRAMSGVCRVQRERKEGFCIATPRHWIRAWQGEWRKKGGAFCIERDGTAALRRWRAKQ